MKKLFSLSIVSLIALSTLVPLTQAASNDWKRLTGSGVTGSGRVLNLECAALAVSTREASVLAAYETLSTTLISELNVRAKGLNSAWSMEDVSNRRVTREAAWSTWRINSKAARDAFRTSRIASWNTYRSSMAACRIPTNEIDNSRIQAMDVQ